MDNISEVNKKIQSSQKLLIGLGKNVNEETFPLLKQMLNGKDYFIVSMASDNTALESVFDSDHLTMPFVYVDDDTGWKKYLSWLENTLNRELLVMEFEVSFENPTVIRFPFEKTVFYNNKAFLVRVNERFYQLPEEISAKGIGFKTDTNSFLNDLFKDSVYAKIN